MLIFVIIFLIVVGGLITLYTAEAWIDLDRWIADAPKREKNGYREPNIVTSEPTQVIEPYKKLNIKLENFPKTSEEAKARVQKLLENAKKSS